MNLLFLGASNTDCGHCFTADNLGNGYVKRTCELLCEIQSMQTDDNTGCSCAAAASGHPVSASIPSHLHAVNGGTDGFTFPRIYQKWNTMYRYVSFDTVTILGGINEVGALTDSGLSRSAYQILLQDSADALLRLLSELTESGVRNILVLEPFLFDTPAYLQSWKGCLDDVRQMIRRVLSEVSARSCKLRYLPTQHLLDQEASRLGVSAVTTDGIHLAPAGHDCLAGMLAHTMQSLSFAHTGCDLYL